MSKNLQELAKEYKVALAKRAKPLEAKTQLGCCDCVCCCNGPILEVAQGLNDHCCKCCAGECTPDEHKEAIRVARVGLIEALLHLEAFEQCI